MMQPKKMRLERHLPLAFAVLILVCTSAVIAFPTTAAINTRHRTLFRTSPAHSIPSALQAVNGEHKKGNNNKSSRFDELTPASINYLGLTTNGGRYVPDGLSAEEYQDIKKKEAEKLAKMDFAAWGPRFKRTSAPEGDWMVKPGLWMQGFQSGGGASSSMTEQELNRREIKQRQLAIVRSLVTSFVFAYLLLDILLLSSASIRSASTSKRVMASVLAKDGILHALKQHFFSSLAFSKIQCLKLALAALATPALQRYREVAQRRWLWSKRRQFGTPLLASAAFVTTWATVALRVAALR